MKKLIYGALLAIPALMLGSCSGTEDYDAYVASLKAQPAAIDTISTPAGYTAYLDTLRLKADNFQQLGVKLNDDQKQELSLLSMEIQKALEARYALLIADSTATAELPADALAATAAEAPAAADSLKTAK